MASALETLSSSVAAGSCATFDRESSQGRKAAALSESVRVPQITWSPLCPPKSNQGTGHRARARRQHDRKASALAHHSLYRTYRPGRFSDLIGQDHVAKALRSAVANERHGHAYLFSGPRGTGKTSTARILAKALNCTNPQDADPCNQCDSCTQITAGSSMDVHELDAASNNGVEAMRELVNRASLGTPGRWKVYIVDEVHMLTTAASNALLKTLEEPPGHVVFVLATTDPQKVLPTIRSRTQSFEFKLVALETLVEHLTWVSSDASLEVSPETIRAAAKRGNGSVRDALSALDRAAAAGELEDPSDAARQILACIASQDAAALLAQAAGAANEGVDARVLTTDLVAEARLLLLQREAPKLVEPTKADSELIDLASQLTTPKIIKTIRLLGEAQVSQKDALDPMAVLEATLVELCLPPESSAPSNRGGNDSATLVDLQRRVKQLEALLNSAPPNLSASPNRSAESGTSPANSQAPTPTSRPPAKPRAQEPSQSATSSRSTITPPPPMPGRSKPVEAPDEPQTTALGKPGVDRDHLVLAWPEILESLSRRAKARLMSGRFTDVTGNVASLGLPNEATVERCLQFVDDLQSELSKRFGSMKVRMVVDHEQVSPTASSAPQARSEAPPIDDIPDQRTVDESIIIDAKTTADFLLEAFPGSEVLESPTDQ